MKQKDDSLKGSLDRLQEKEIYLNINHLQDGTYVLKITHKNIIIKETRFNKSQKK
jgi:predicted thioesterase